MDGWWSRSREADGMLGPVISCPCVWDQGLQLLTFHPLAILHTLPVHTVPCRLSGWLKGTRVGHTAPQAIPTCLHTCHGSALNISFCQAQKSWLSVLHRCHRLHGGSGRKFLGFVLVSSLYMCVCVCSDRRLEWSWDFAQNRFLLSVKRLRFCGRRSSFSWTNKIPNNEY